MEDGYYEAYGKCPKCGGYKIEQKSERSTPPSRELRIFDNPGSSEELSILSYVWNVVFTIFFVGGVGLAISFGLAAFAGLFSETRGKLTFIFGIIFTVGLIIWELFIPKKVIQGESYSIYRSRCCICGYRGIGTWDPNSDD